MIVKQKPTLKRAWFIRGGELLSGADNAADGGKYFGDECRKLKLKSVQSFNSWNDNEGALALALDKNNNPVVLGGEPWMRRVTLSEAVRFLAEMCHESEQGEDGYYKRDFFKVVAAQLESGFLLGAKLAAQVQRYSESVKLPVAFLIEDALKTAIDSLDGEIRKCLSEHYAAAQKKKTPCGVTSLEGRSL